MLKHLHRYRRTLRFLGGVAAIVLCGAQVLDDRHLHDTTVPEELCSVCGCSESALALAGSGSALQALPWAHVDYPWAVSAPLVSRPFENSRSRAPPVS